MSSSTRMKSGRLLLLVGLLISLIGAGMPALVYDGSAMGKYLVTKDVKERVHEEEIEALSSDYLFGDEEVDMGRLKELSEDSATASEDNLVWAEKLSRVEFWMLIVLLTLLAACVLCHRKLSNSWITLAVVFLSGAYLFLQALGVTLNGGKPFADLAIAAHAARWGMALVMVSYLLIEKFERSFNRPSVQLGVQYLALVCCAATFAVHGWEALNHHPAFQDLIHGTVGLVGIAFSEKIVLGMLTVIGVMDLTLAILTVLHPSRALLMWMAIWAGITAFSRPLSIGLSAWHEVAVRSGNLVLPLFLALGFVPLASVYRGLLQGRLKGSAN